MRAVNWTDIGLAIGGVIIGALGASLLKGKLRGKAPYSKEDYKREADKRRDEIKAKESSANGAPKSDLSGLARRESGRD